MGSAVQYYSSRCVDFLNISANTIPRLDEYEDLIVGENVSATMVLENGTLTKYRDIVVLGELNIQSSDLENTVVKPELVVRDFIFPAKLSIENVVIKCERFLQPKNIQAFRYDLEELCLLDWLDFQRESVNKIGLKSILVPDTTTTWQHLPK
jgi:hypothetical protein